MVTHLAVLSAATLAATSAVAQELGPQEAWTFMVDKPFALTCADGTVGEGHILADGSVVGKIRVGGHGEMRPGTLPPRTVRVSDTQLCAHFGGLLIDPCLKVRKINRRKFHASLSILGFSFCEIDSLIARPVKRTR